MGEMADYYMDLDMINHDNELENESKVTRVSKWTMRNKETIRIKDMETNHIANILKMVREGRMDLPDNWLNAFTREYNQRTK